MVVPCGRILGRIVEKVEQHLLEQHGVELQHRQIGRELDLDPVLREDLAGALQGGADDLADVVERSVRRDRAGFEPGHVEQVGDEAVEPLRFVVDRREKVGLGSSSSAASESPAASRRRR